MPELQFGAFAASFSGAWMLLGIAGGSGCVSFVELSKRELAVVSKRGMTSYLLM